MPRNPGGRQEASTAKYRIPKSARVYIHIYIYICIHIYIYVSIDIHIERDRSNIHVCNDFLRMFRKAAQVLGIHEASTANIAEREREIDRSLKA